MEGGEIDIERHVAGARGVGARPVRARPSTMLSTSTGASTSRPMPQAGSGSWGRQQLEWRLGRFQRRRLERRRRV